jgi:hypothetical protein
LRALAAHTPATTVSSSAPAPPPATPTSPAATANASNGNASKADNNGAAVPPPAAPRGAAARRAATEPPEVNPLVPTPRVIQRLAAPDNLGPLATLLLTHDPALMRGACALLLAVARAHAAALHRLYTTGAFFFTLAYVGRDLQPIGELLRATHTEQHFQGAHAHLRMTAAIAVLDWSCNVTVSARTMPSFRVNRCSKLGQLHLALAGAQDAAARANLPLGEQSVLGTMLPESLLYQLDAYGAAAFAEQMVRQIDDPEVRLLLMTFHFLLCFLQVYLNCSSQW